MRAGRHRTSGGRTSVATALVVAAVGPAGHHPAASCAPTPSPPAYRLSAHRLDGHYVVDGTFTVVKQALDDHPAVRAARSGRLVLIGCHRENGLEDETTPTSW